MTGTRMGWPVPCIQRLPLAPPPTSYSGVVSYWPLRIRLALAVVPPMSNDSRSRWPVCRATSAAATTPAAGPDSTAMAGMATVSAASRMPPFDPITYRRGRPWPRVAPSSRSRYEARIGPT